MSKQALINYFVENNYQSITDTGKTWHEIGKLFNMSGETARGAFRRYKTSAMTLVLRSRWQAQTKTGIEWLESYRNVPTGNEIVSVLNNITPLQFQPVKDVQSTGNIGLYYLSDEHIGSEVSGGIYENTYNAEVFKQRIETIYQNIINHAQLTGNFENLFIVNLGDSVDGYNGFTTRGGHQLPQNMTNKEVFNTYISVHAGLLSSLRDAGIAKNIYYVAISDSNHGGDIEYMCHKSLEHMMSQSGITFKVIEKFIDHIIIGKRCFCFTHGKDAVDRKKGLPLHLNADTEVYVKQYLDINNLHEYDVSLVKGDLHVSASLHSKFFRYRNTASIYGSSKWMMTNFGYSEPACDYDLIINDQLLEGRISLDKPLRSNAIIKL